MRFKLADDLKLRPREWSILRYLLSQFPNEAFYKRISLSLLNEKHVNWQTWHTLYPPLDFAKKLVVSSPDFSRIYSTPSYNHFANYSTVFLTSTIFGWAIIPFILNLLFLTLLSMFLTPVPVLSLVSSVVWLSDVELFLSSGCSLLSLSASFSPSFLLRKRFLNFFKASFKISGIFNESILFFKSSVSFKAIFKIFQEYHLYRLYFLQN